MAPDGRAGGTVFATPPGVEPRTIQRHGGFSLIELLVVIAIIAIVASIALPGLMRARLAANETSAIASLRAIGSAQVTFASTCGGGFAGSLEDLGRPPAGSTVAFVSDDLVDGQKSGYLFAVRGLGAPLADAETCNGSDEAFPSFLAAANPVSDGTSGVRAFGIDKSNALRWSGSADGITDGASYSAAWLVQ